MRKAIAASAVWSGTFTAAVDDEGLFNVLLTGLDAGKFTGGPVALNAHLW